MGQAPNGEHMGPGNCRWGFGHRRYLNKDERRELLKDYAKDLENELKGVQERLKELESD